MNRRPTRHPRLCRLLFAVLLAGFFCGGVAGGDWPQLLGPSRNGVSSETGLATSWPAQGPPVVWARKVGQGYSGPVVAGGRLILFHRLGDEEVVECLDAATGKGHWKTAYPTAYQDAYGKGDGPRSTPLVADQRVYTLGAEGTLHCLDLESGKVIWKRALLKDYEVPPSFFGVGASPLLVGDLLLINVGGKGAGIVAFERETGKEVWKATGQGASYSSPVAATINGTRHVFFWTREGLVSLDPQRGTVRFSWPWRSRIAASVNAATPIVVGDQLFLSACYGVGAVLLRVRPDGVDQVWKNDELGNHYDTSIQANGYLYGVDGRQDVPPKPRLRCLELKTGKVRWTQERFGCASAVLADGHLIELTEDGDLVLIEAAPDAYREKARAHVLSKPCRAAIALSGGRLYGRDPHQLVCWNLNK